MMRALFLMTMAVALARDARTSSTSLTGSVTTPAGEAIVGARVTLYACRDHREQHETQSLADGSFAVRGLASDYYDIDVCKPGFVTWKSGTAAGVSRERVVLSPQARIVGRVMDRDSRRPLRDFVIRWRDQHRPLARDRDAAFVACSLDGGFDVFLDPGTYVISVAAAGVASITLAPLTLASGEVHGLEDIELLPAHRVCGRIVDAQGALVAGAIVKCYDPRHRFAPVRSSGWVCELPSGEDYRAALIPSQVVQTRADGSFAFAWTNNRCEMVVAQEGFVARFLDEDTASDRELGDVVLSRGGRIVGHVTGAADLPLPGAIVRAYDESSFYQARATCDALGAFSLEGLAPGAWTIRIDAIGGPSPMRRLHLERSCRSITVVDGECVTTDLRVPLSR